MEQHKRLFDIIVVGGGVSGLSCVYHLLKNGFHGTIGLLESRDRLGGRILSSKTQFEEAKIEIGANWIHGIIDNPIYNILYNKQFVDPVTQPNKGSYNIQAKTRDGKDVNSYWVHKVCNAYSDIFKRSTLFYKNQSDDIISNCNDSLGQFLRKEIDIWIDREVKNQSVVEVTREIFSSLLKRETCISGTHSLDDVSLQYIGAYEEFLGGNLTIPKGYVSLIESLLEDIHGISQSNQFQVFKQCNVTKIVWKGIDNSERVKSEVVSSHDIKIECQNSSQFFCNHVIVTIPLGCLKKNVRQLCDPPLPCYKLECIDRMGFGTVDKIFLEYSSKEVISNRFSLDGVITDEMILLWENEQAWYNKIYSIYYVSDHCIQLWVSGKEAQAMESLSEDQVNDDLTEQLRKFFNDPKFPRADHVIMTKWGNDEWSLGSYSYISTGSSQQDIKQLAMPIYRHQEDAKPVIAFAGEATHERYFSTVHGAFLSGQEVAKHFTICN